MNIQYPDQPPAWKVKLTRTVARRETRRDEARRDETRRDETRRDEGEA